MKIKKWFTFERSIWLGIVGIMVTIICTVVTLYYQHTVIIDKPDKLNNPQIIMLGSGTVTEFLKVNCPNISKTVYFFDGPSITALEVLINSKDDKKSQIQMIVMSSSEIVKDSLKEWGWESNKHKLFEIKLGDDELNVIMWPPSNSIAEIHKGEQIDLETLYYFLKNDSLDYNLYTTTEKSGTKTEFKKYLNKIGPFNWKPDNKLYNLKDDVFYEIDNSKILSVILCSSYYQHNKFKDNRLKVVYENVTVKRGLFLYFIGTIDDLTELEHKGHYSLENNDIITKILNEKKLKNEFTIEEGYSERDIILKLRPW